MSYKYALIIAATGLLSACSNASAPEKTAEKVQNPELQNQLVKCYEYIKNQDTVQLKTMHIGENIMGMLVYKLYEKDANKGLIKGQMNGDVLIADYTFKSEGTESVRQVAFKQQGNDYIEGYGDMEEKNGKMVFKDVTALKFNADLVLKSVNCK